ncbi:SAG family member [Eimeria tenella]|uniref:SAG family member n=1 Tax=Eimeria tenella TaxID=5802 RepID=U6KR45_EIMTE|nr:LOW QUALITY PROTEIN: SAG family member [Eimeria tenella]CDJ40592.1 SAG family member [Eimeria tenella]|eukprot:XP_013231342.1 LOW QUALITY PROTEIN: SAG family member [Eimeria tenella]
MASFLKCICLASALLVLRAAAEVEQPPSGSTISYSVKLGSDGECLAEVNAAREAAKLSKLQQPGGSEGAKRLPGVEPVTPWEPLCKELIPPAQGTPANAKSGNEFNSGTYAYIALNSATPNCSAAVDHWKAAYKNFSGVPPAYKDNTTLYSKQDNISFVALYNPSKDATADCRVVTCTETTTPQSPGQEGSGTQRHGYALLCMTTPDILKENESAPFTQDQWNAISRSITGSASVAVPSLVALAAASLSIAFL